MKAFIKMYAYKNLGDDLLLWRLAGRYPNIEFDAALADFYSEKDLPPNVHINNERSFKHRLLTRAGIMRSDKDILKKYDVVCYIGGSIFIENPSSSANEHILKSAVDVYKRKGTAAFLMGACFGPYISEGYYTRHKEYFSAFRDVCMRDRASYSMFAALPQARYAPDMIFGLKLSRRMVKKTLGITFVNMEEDRFSEEKRQAYYDFLSEICAKYKKKGYNIKLFDFCVREGGGEEHKKLIGYAEYIPYTEEPLKYAKKFISCEKVIAVRFHAVVLAAIGGVECLPVSYSDKNRNVFDDLKLFENYSDIHKMKYTDKFQKAKLSLALNADGVFEKTDEFFRK